VQVSGPFRKRVREALESAYPTIDALGIMLQESLDVTLQAITSDRDSRQVVVFNLIVWAIAHGRLTELVQAAATDNPGNELLKEVARGFSFTKSEAGEVERVVLENVGFENVGQWLEKLASLRRQVCRIEPQPGSIDGYGTGFLVARDIVVTNSHVRSAFADPAQVVFRFDYEADARGPAVSAGRECRLAGGDYCLAESSADELDYAFVRLEERAGEDQIAGSARGFVRPRSTTLTDGEPIVILQHPAAEPLKLSIGSISDRGVSDNFVQYSANTKGGSSGSPCLNMRLDVVALHHQGRSKSNRGVLWGAIEAHLKSTGKRHLLG